MKQDETKPKRPVEGLRFCKSFYADLGFHVSHFDVIWHTFKVGQLLGAELNRVSSVYGLSISDYHMLSVLLTAAPDTMRATDLAYALNVSAAALSIRSRKLADKGLLLRLPDEADRRAVNLRLTEEGVARVMEISQAFEAAGGFIRRFQSLPEADRQEMGRIIAELHTRLDKEFMPARRSDP